MTVEGLTAAVLAGDRGPDPAGMVATSVFWCHHGTRLAGGKVTYRNQYLLARVGTAFGACAFESGDVDPEICAEASGNPLADLLRVDTTALRVATLDAYLGAVAPHRTDQRAERVELPVGTPEARATARAAAVAGLLDVPAGAKVALIGVVNPLVAAIRERGAEPLPCDLNLRETQWGDRVTADMTEVLDTADAVVATGMTIGNGTFDTILARCGERNVPLIVYAQTGAAIAREFLGAGVTALSAEPFPFSQFSADPTALYVYRA
jgi:hypothetical protein